jgi:hypothetical protein
MEFIMLAVMVAAYFLPGLIAYMRGHHNVVSIMLLNLFLGWTLIGWVAALVWAASATKPSGT